MKTIEFIGPSGIGKSTFLSSYEKYLAEKNSPVAISQYQASELIRKKYVKYPLYHKLRRMLKGKGQLDYIKKKSQLFEENSKELEPIVDLFILCIQRSGLKTWKKIWLSEYYFDKILYQIAKIHDAAVHDCVILEEGIIQNGFFANVELELVKNANLSRLKLMPKGVVIFTLDEEEYKNRINKRFKKRGRNDLNAVTKRMSPEEVEAHVRMTKEVTETHKIIVSALQLPYLIIDAHATRHNFEKLDNFINKLSSQV